MRNNILLILFLLWSESAYCENSACGQTEITLTEKTTKIELPAASQKFKAMDECVLTITAKPLGVFDMTIPKIHFLDDCEKQFVAAAITKDALEKPSYKQCGTAAVTNPFRSTSGQMFVKVKTTEVGNDPSVTLQFDKVNTASPCGNPVVQLANDRQILRLPVAPGTFTETSDCVIEINGVQGHQFTMTIPQINFLQDCEKQFVAAAATRDALQNPSYKKCGTAAVTDPFRSTSGQMFVRVKTSEVGNDPSVTLQFDKVSTGSECGNPVLQLTSDHQLLQLPVPPSTFTETTNCIVEVKGVESRDFRMTIPSINFLSDCTKQFVAAATTRDGLATAQYRKCGTTAVTDPIQSASGTLFVQIKTTMVANMPTVTLEFNKGRRFTSQYTVLLFALLIVSKF